MMIDLGDVSAAATDALQRRPRVLRPAQAIGLVALVVLMLVGAAASGVPSRPPLSVVADLRADRDVHLLIQDDRAIVVDLRNGTNEVSAFALPGGRHLWTSALAGFALNSLMVDVGTTLIVDVPRINAPGSIAEAFDMRTGAVLWQRSALDVQPIAGGLLLYGTAAGDAVGSGSTVARVDEATGATRWTIAVPDDCAMATADDPTRLLELGLVELCSGTQELTVYDLATGLIRARRVVVLGPNLATDTKLAVPPHILTVGSVILVAVNSRYPSMSVSAFRTSDLAPLWSGLPVNADDRVETCGPDLCLGGNEPAVTLDPQTGQVLADHMNTVTSSADPAPIAGDHLVVLPAQQDVAPVAEGQDVQLSAAGEGRALIGLRSSSGLALLQALPGTPADACVTIATYVACGPTSRGITLWSLR